MSQEVKKELAEQNNAAQNVVPVENKTESIGDAKAKTPPVKQAKPAQPAEKPAIVVRPVASKATPKRRHWGLVLSFIIFVIGSTLLSAWYLYERAADQYISTVAFSVRSEDMASPLEILGGLTNTSSGLSSNTDVLYKYIQSQSLVSKINGVLNLRQLYSKPENDPVFSFEPDQPIEKLVKYWQRMVKVIYDTTTGLIEVRVHAFSAQDAQDIATEILQESDNLVNELAAQARQDATKYALEEVDKAVERLKAARQAMTEFRNINQIVDPTTDIQGQLGLMVALQQQLGEALIEKGLLEDTTRSGDPRLEQVDRKIKVIEERINDEKKKFGISEASGNEVFSNMVGDYEALVVDREYAERSYIAALTAYDTAVAEANRRNIYLAAYIKPTLAETAEYPQRIVLVSLVALFSFLLWMVASLIYYSVRERR